MKGAVILKVVKAFLSLIFLGVFYLLMSYFKIKNEILLTIVFGLALFSYIFIKNKGISCFFYLVFLGIVLFFRDKANNQFSNGSYFNLWIKILFTNKTVFKNVFGNILLFVPLGFFLSRIMKPVNVFLVSFLVVLTAEIIQFNTRFGVFDYLDIILNLIGSVVGIVIVKLKRGVWA